jgi:hypothetical protein
MAVRRAAGRPCLARQSRRCSTGRVPSRRANPGKAGPLLATAVQGGVIPRAEIRQVGREAERSDPENMVKQMGPEDAVRRERLETIHRAIGQVRRRVKGGTLDPERGEAMIRRPLDAATAMASPAHH